MAYHQQQMHIQQQQQQQQMRVPQGADGVSISALVGGGGGAASVGGVAVRVPGGLTAATN